MSNNQKRRCPSCGAMMPAELKYCRKCQARMDPPDVDLAEDLPRPVRPETEDPESYEKSRETETRRPRTREYYEYSQTGNKKKEKGSPWKGIAILALLIVVVVVAVVLVISLKNTSDDEADGTATQGESETYEGVYVVEPSDAAQNSDDEAAAGAPVTVDDDADDSDETGDEDGYTELSDVVYTTSSGVNLRTGPGTTYDVVASVGSGVALERTAIDGNWSEVMYEGQACFVNNSLITTEAPENAEDTEEDDSTAASTPTPSFTVTATDPVTVYVISDVNLRTGPSTDYSIVDTVTTGTALTRTGTTGYWSQVEYNGQTLYAYSSYLSTTKVTAESNTTTTTTTNSNTNTTDVPTSTAAVTSASGTVYTTDRVNLRTGPGLDYDVVTTVATGTALTRTGTTGEWTQVSYNGQTVYVYNQYISTDTTSASLSSKSGTVTIVSEANVRSGPGTTYEILGVMEVGETATVTGYTSTNWYQVSYNGAIGYIAGNLVSFS